MKREVDLVVISDVHLGTYGCRAKELLHYLYSIKPSKLILNGDIVDIWQFKKSYFPDQHLRVIKYLLDMAYQGTEIVYVTGNHDEMLRKFTNIHFGNIQMVDKLIMSLGNKKAWIFHGDVFDASVQHSKWLAKLGGWGYDVLIQVNNGINWFLTRMGREKYSLSKRIKNSVKEAVKFISDFEDTASELAIESRYDYVICGHIHQPQMRTVTTKKGACMYLNSGDWIENLSALEYNNGVWRMFLYEEEKDTLGKYPAQEATLSYSLESILERVKISK